MEQPHRVNRYELIRAVPTAGATAFKAWDPYFERYVALKAIPAERYYDVDFRKHFRSRHQAAAQLDHPNIAHTYDYVEEDGSAYQVLEFLEGVTLRDRMERDAAARQDGELEGIIPLDEKLRIVIEILNGLESAHRSGVVHGELNPSKVFLTEGRETKLLDLDLVPEDTSDTWSTDTAEAYIYRAPERFSAPTVDARADIWSSGVILYELLTGKLPFQGSGADSLIDKIAYAEPKRVDALAPELPKELNVIVSRALSKDSGERYRSAAEMAEEIMGVLECLAEPIAKLEEENLLEVAQNMLARLQGHQELLNGKLLEGFIDPSDPIDNQLAAILLLEMTDARTLVELYPKNLDEVYDRLLEVLKSAATVQSALVEIGGFEEVDELEQALRSADALVQEFPNLRVARELVEALRDKLIERSSSARLVDVARAFLSMESFELAWTLLESVVIRDRANTEARALLETVTASIESRDREAHATLERARNLDLDGRLEEAIAVAREGLGDSRHRSAARELVARLEAKQAARKRELHIKKSFDKAQLFRDHHDHDRALAVLGEVLTLDPLHDEARELERRLKGERDELRRRAGRRGFEERNRVLAQKAVDAFDCGDLESALTFAHDVADSSEAYADARNVVERVERRRRCNKRLEEARREFDAGNLDVARSTVGAVVEEDPDFIDASVFADVVERAFERRAAQAYVDKTLRAAVSAAKRRHYGDAIALADDVLQKHPRHRTARSLKRRFRSSQKRVESLLRQAESFLKASRPETALKRLNELVALDPDNVAAAALRAKAEERLSLRTMRGRYLFARKHARRHPRIAAALAFAVAMVLALGILLLVQPSPEEHAMDAPAVAVTSGSGYAWIDVAPWAEILWIRRNDGSDPPFPPNVITPVRVTLPAGLYTVELRNHLDPDLPLMLELEVRPNETVVLRGVLDGFSHEEIPLDF